MTDKYISAKSLKGKLNYIFRAYGTSTVTKEAVKEAINRLPSADVVEVVRCKDCIHSKESPMRIICQKYGRDVNEDGYCSCGERKKE